MTLCAKITKNIGLSYFKLKKKTQRTIFWHTVYVENNTLAQIGLQAYQCIQYMLKHGEMHKHIIIRDKPALFHDCTQTSYVDNAVCSGITGR